MKGSLAALAAVALAATVSVQAAPINSPSSALALCKGLSECHNIGVPLRKRQILESVVGAVTDIPGQLSPEQSVTPPAKTDEPKPSPEPTQSPAPAPSPTSEPPATSPNSPKPEPTTPPPADNTVKPPNPTQPPSPAPRPRPTSAPQNGGGNPEGGNGGNQNNGGGSGQNADGGQRPAPEGNGNPSGGNGNENNIKPEQGTTNPENNPNGQPQGERKAETQPSSSAPVAVASNPPPAPRLPGPVPSITPAPTTNNNQAKDPADPRTESQQTPAPAPGKMLSKSATAGIVASVGIISVAGIVAAGLIIQKRRGIATAASKARNVDPRGSSGPGVFMNMRTSMQSNGSINTFLSKALPGMFGGVEVKETRNVPMVAPPGESAVEPAPVAAQYAEPHMYNAAAPAPAQYGEPLMYNPQYNQQLYGNIELPPVTFPEEGNDENGFSTIERAVSEVFARNSSDNRRSMYSARSPVSTTFSDTNDRSYATRDSIADTVVSHPRGNVQSLLLSDRDRDSMASEATAKEVWNRAVRKHASIFTLPDMDERAEEPMPSAGVETSNVEVQKANYTVQTVPETTVMASIAAAATSPDIDAHRFSGSTGYSEYTATIDRYTTASTSEPRDSIASADDYRMSTNSRRASWFTTTSGHDTYRRSMLSSYDGTMQRLHIAAERRGSLDLGASQLERNNSVDSHGSGDTFGNNHAISTRITAEPAHPQSSILLALNHIGTNVNIAAPSLGFEDEDEESEASTLKRPAKQFGRADTIRSGGTSGGESFATALETQKAGTSTGQGSEWGTIGRKI